MYRADKPRPMADRWLKVQTPKSRNPQHAEPFTEPVSPSPHHPRWWSINKAPAEVLDSAQTSRSATATRGHEQILFQMLGKGAQDWMRLPLRVDCTREVVMQALDRFAD